MIRLLKRHSPSLVSLKPMTRAQTFWPCLGALLLCAEVRADPARFRDQIRPLLDSKCVSCHGPEKQKGGLRLDSRAAALKGGEHGPAFVPGDVAKSLLLQAVRHATKDLAMPPKEKLPAKDIAALEAWVKAGALWPEPVAVLFEDEEEFLGVLTSGNGKARLVTDDVFRGKAALGMTPLQRDAVQVPGWHFMVREHPGPGQFRFLRLAWKKRGGGSVMLELARSGKWPDAKDPKGRYVAGPNTTGWAAISVADTAPSAWTVVTVDLWKDFGDCTLTGLAPTCDTGDEAFFDSILLGADVESLDAYAPGNGQLALKVAAPAKHLGDAWTDPENPIRKIWRGERLDLWSLKAPVRPAVPSIGNRQSQIANSIDRFLLAKLGEKKLTLSTEADPRTLIRRLYFDLIGLPPSPEDIEAFVRDCSLSHSPTFTPARAQSGEQAGKRESVNTAYERLVDRLLASPRYGERWARHWLDVVRYADSNGHERDEFRPEMWRYRDYVVRSLNEDKPYDRFIREQLAGDELLAAAPRTPAEADALIATGFLRLGTYDSTASIFQEERKQRNDLMADLVNTTGSAFLGLTFSCCNCHDHKYDPLSQADHFRFRAFFAAVKSRDDTAIDLAPEQDAIKAHNAGVDAKIDEAQKPVDDALWPARKKLRDERIAKLPADIQELLKTDEAKRDEATKKKVAPHLEKIKVSEKDALAALDDAGKKRHAELMAKVDEVKKQRRAFTVAMAVSDGNAEPTKLFFQGDFTEPRDEVAPGFISVLDPNPAKVKAPRSDTTGRRLALAEWIASPANPFTARVLVNRLWQHHFGTGLFANPNDLGYAGPKPTHPELLDWLATEFVARGWSVKAMHRLMVTSAAYRQASGQYLVISNQSPTATKSALSTQSLITNHSSAQRLDPGDHLLWRQSPRRLDAETMRDTLLAVSGKLRPRAGGKPLWPPLPEEILRAQPGVLEGLEGKDSGRRQGWYADKEEDCDVRSLYLIQKRCVPLPFLQVFDLPDTASSCARRDVTTVAPQALNLLNSDFSLRAAKALAARVAKEAGDDSAKQIERAVWLTLSRAPSATERQQATAFLAKHGKAALPEFCRALLNVNEFVYVD
ncbi:MAG: DUF1553 domain-containing protein [Limisphaerales bacterium]